MRRLYEGGDYSRAASIRGNTVGANICACVLRLFWCFFLRLYVLKRKGLFSCDWMNVVCQDASILR